MSSRRANAVLFGFDFQVNAAIMLMLENMADLESLRLESNYEDIDLTLADGRHVLAQAKAVENSSSDFRNVRSNLKKALESLSEGSKGIDTKQLILITNSPNPFNDDASRSIFWGPSKRTFSSLPLSAQQIVNGYLENIEDPLDANNFSVHVFPFETDDDDERYKAVLWAIDNFIGNLNINIPGLTTRLMEVWHYKIFTNGTKKNAAINLDKKSIIWPIMVITTDIEKCDEDFLNEFDPAAYEEIVRHYRATIDDCCERIEFFSKVLSDFLGFQTTKRGRDRFMEFVNQRWREYYQDFSVDGIDPETQEGLTKVVLYNIIRRRFTIDKIKRGVNL